MIRKYKTVLEFSANKVTFIMYLFPKLLIKSTAINGKNTTTYASLPREITPDMLVNISDFVIKWELIRSK